jgi:hypothetical protein
LKHVEMNLNYGRGKANKPLVKLTSIKAEGLPVPVKANGTWSAPVKFDLSKDDLAKIMKPGIVISLKVNPAGLVVFAGENQKNVQNLNEKEINASCCSVEINNGEGETYKHRVSVLADANTATIPVDELLQRAVGAREIVWGRFDGRDYLQKFQGLNGTPIPLPYKKDSGFWVVRLFDDTGEVELTGNWRTLEVGTDAKIAVTYKSISSYLEESTVYADYPDAVSDWIETKTLEDNFWETIKKQAAGQKIILPAISTNYDRLKKEYATLQRGYPKFFENHTFNEPKKRLQTILKAEEYDWPQFILAVRSAEVKWTVKKAVEENWFEDPELKLEFAKYDPITMTPAKKVDCKDKNNENQPWEVNLFNHNAAGQVKNKYTAWKPYDNIKYTLFEDDYFGDDIFINRSSSSFFSLGLMVEKVHFRDFAINGIVPPSYCRFRVHYVRGPVSRLTSADLDVPKPAEVLKGFIDENMPKVVSQKDYTDFFGEGKKVVKLLSAQGTQVGYSQAGYVLDAYSKLAESGLSHVHLVDSIEKFSRALDFTKVIELGHRFEGLKSEILMSGSVRQVRSDYADQLVSMAKTCKELKSYDGLYSINYAIQNMCWALERIEGNPVEKVKADDKKILQDRLEQITVDLDGLDQNPMELKFLKDEWLRLSTMVSKL